MQEMVGHLGSLYLIGNLHWRMELTCSVRYAFFGTFVFLLIVTKSFKNLAYDGTCWIASKNGMFIWTCLNSSKILANCAFFFGAFNLSRYGAFGINDYGGSLTMGVIVDGSAPLSSLLSSPFSLPWPTFLARSASGSAWFASHSATWLSTRFLDLSMTIVCACS